MVRPTELNFSFGTLPFYAANLPSEVFTLWPLRSPSKIPTQMRSGRLPSYRRKAGIHPLPPLHAGLRRHEESREEPCGAGDAAVSDFL